MREAAPGNTACRKPLTAALALALCGAQSVHAQDEQAPAPGANAPQTLDAVTVTSQGRSEKLQKAAAPIAVFNEFHIQDAGIQTTGDFVRLVPNMSYDTSFTIGNSFVTMRGIQQINKVDAPVAIVVDGVPQTNQKEFKMELFDIEQIEVLRGPQGGLYGRNAVAGAVVIKTKQPSNATEGFVQAGVGNHGLRKLGASLSGPLAEDRLFYRMSLSASDFDGAIRNAYSGRRVDHYRGHDLRGQLKWVPGEDHQVDLRLNSSLLRGGAIYDTSFEAGAHDATNTWQPPLSDIPGESRRRIDGTSLKYRWDGEAMTFTSITAYTHIFEDYDGDLDFCNPDLCPGGLFGNGQAAQAQEMESRQLSQEFRLGSPEGAGLPWTAGVYLLDTRLDLHTHGRLLEQDPEQVLVDRHRENRDLAWAVFGQAQLPLGEAQRLDLSLRLDRDRRRQIDPASGAVRRKLFSAWQPKFTYSRDLDETRMLYATVGRGFRSGGFNGIGGPAFRPEIVTNYEVGYKTSWLDNRLIFNNAFFHQRDKGYQFSYVDLGAGAAQVIANLGRVDITGFESEANWRVRPGWELFGSLGLLHSRIVEVGDLNTDLPIGKGNRAPRTSPYSLVAGSQWNFALGAYHAMFRFDVSRKGERTWEVDNSAVMDPVTLLNTRFTFFGHGGWNVTAWATNLLDERYYADYTSDAFGGPGRDLAFPAPGRRFGLDFRHDF